MYLIVGLGNPGNDYALNRHNAGWIVLDRLFEGLEYTNFSPKSRIGKVKIGKAEAIVLKPQTYMNLSGHSVQEVMNFYKIKKDDLIVIHDDIDLPLGTVKSSTDSSSAGHNGVQSIIECLGTQEFKRIRVGIGRPIDQTPIDQYVLQDLTEEELTALEKTLPLIKEELKKLAS